MTITGLDRLNQRRERIIRQLATIKHKTKLADRKVETRKKILIGAMILQRVNNDSAMKERLLTQLDPFLIKPSDRKIFGLPQIERRM
tara:strand:- start:26798 stop:27058 length:261 start_codon:yes stop_codon:yes gene_type:complete